jgi:Zn-dependent peptidase ImmA (M78 family)
MSDWKEAARRALRNALETRRRVSVSKSQAICVYDVAEQLGVEVIFRPENSLEGMYVKVAQTILIPSHRPAGRQSFTCAHELGHWLFGHGTHVDVIADLEDVGSLDPEEQLVNTFAGYLLMPPWAVKEAFARRNWHPSDCTAMQLYTVAGQLGVGYETLAQHMRYSLHLLSQTQSEQLLRTTPKQLRRSLLGNDNTRHLLIVDRAWSKVAVDLQVEDIAILPAGTRLEGRSATVVGDSASGVLVEGRVPGVTRAESSDGSWATFIRVCRKDFIGRSVFRHLEDPDVDEGTGSNF